MNSIRTILIMILFSLKAGILSGQVSIQETDTTQQQSNINHPETYPSFSYKGKKAGIESLREFCIDNLKYPQTQDCIGKVYVSFIVETDSTISNIEIYRSIGCDEFDKEAIRVVRLMNGLWTPATNKNLKIQYKMIIPVSFRLDDYK